MRDGIRKMSKVRTDPNLPSRSLLPVAIVVDHPISELRVLDGR